MKIWLDKRHNAPKGWASFFTSTGLQKYLMQLNNLSDITDISLSKEDEDFLTWLRKCPLQTKHIIFHNHSSEGNFHSKEKLQEMINRTANVCDYNRTIGVFYIGSANYNLDTMYSDFDTKSFTAPNLEKLCSTQPIKTKTIDLPWGINVVKDIRSGIQDFRTNNFNTIEVLFTDYYMVYPRYKHLWNELLYLREKIARIYPWGAIRSAVGIAEDQLRSIEKMKPNAGKYLSRMLWIEEYIDKYLKNYPYKDCLRASDTEFLQKLKTENVYPYHEIRNLAKESFKRLNKKVDSFTVKEYNESTEIEMKKILIEFIKLGAVKV